MSASLAVDGRGRVARYGASRAVQIVTRLLPCDREGVIAWTFVAVAIAFNAYFLLPEVRIAAPKLNDGVLHLLSLRRMIDAFKAGDDPTDVWFAPVTTGYPLFHHYQHLPFVLPALVSLALPNVGVITIFNATSYLLLCAFPVSVYWSMRRFGFPSIVSALSALMAPLLSTNGLFGFDDLSYVWLGYGMYTQLWGMVLLPPALACGYTTIREGRGYFWSVLLVSAVVLAHLVLGYIALVSLCAFLFLKPSWREVFTRGRRLALVLALAGVVTSYFLVGALSDNSYLNRSVFEAQSKYDAFGYEWTLRALFGGRLFDYGRFRSLTLLVLGGAGVCAWRWREERYRLPAVLGALWLLMYFGRPTWGVLIGLATLNITFYLHRLIAGVHLGGIMLMGIALGLPWTWAFARRNARYLLVPAAITALVLLPVYKERRAYLNSNESYMQASNNAYLRDQGDLDSLMAELRKQPPGRVYAGFRASWGAQYRVGEVPMAGLLNSAGFDMLGYLYFPFSANSDIQALFNESSQDQYNLFNVRYVVAPASRTFPDFVKPIATFGRHRLYRVDTTGYFDLVSSDITFTGDITNFYPGASQWLTSPLLAAKEHPTLLFEGNSDPGVRAMPLASSPAELASRTFDAGPSRGVISSERVEENAYTAKVNILRPSLLMLKETFHPGWHVTVDGVPASTVMLMPSYVAVKMTPGTHNVRFEYRSPRSRLPLLLIGLTMLPLAGLVEWRGRDLRRIAVARLAWLPMRTALVPAPRAAISAPAAAAPPVTRVPRTLTLPSIASWPATRVLAAIVTVATLLRIALTPLYAYLPDNSLDEYAWERWMAAIRQHGVLNIFRTTHTDYVGYHWVLWLLTTAYRWLGDDYRERAVHPGQYAALATPLHLLLKAPPIAFDAALIVVVYVSVGALLARPPAGDPVAADGAEASPRSGHVPPLSALWHSTAGQQRLALVAAASIALQPAVVYESAVWAQIDAAIAAAMLLSVVLFALRRPGWGGAVWALGFAVKPHPVIILPVLAVLGFRLSGWRGVVRAAGGAALVLALILGPWILHGDADRIFSTYKVLFQSDLYSGRLSSAAWNLWWFWDVHSHPLPHDAMFHFAPLLTYKRIGLGLSVSAGLIALVYAWVRPNLRGALIASAYLAFAFYMLPTSTHERYLFPFLALLLPVAVAERRWLWIYVPTSATFALNLLVVAPPIHNWSGRWVESPLSLAVAATNVVLFAAMTVVMAGGVLSAERRRRAATWLPRQRSSNLKPSN